MENCRYGAYARSAEDSSSLISPALSPTVPRKNTQNLAGIASQQPTTRSLPVNDLNINVTTGHRSVLLRRGISDLREHDRRDPTQTTHTNGLRGSSCLISESGVQLRDTLDAAPPSVALSDEEFSSNILSRRTNGPTVSQPVDTLSLSARHEKFSTQRKITAVCDHPNDTTGGLSEAQKTPESNLRSSHDNIAGIHPNGVAGGRPRSPVTSESPSGKRSNHGARIGRSPAPRVRAKLDVPAYPERSSSSSGDMESRIDAIISTTSKRLRDIQQDNGSSNFLEDGLLSCSDSAGANQKALSEYLQHRSEQESAKRVKERDCNVPTFILDLERDSLALAGALCR